MGKSKASLLDALRSRAQKPREHKRCVWCADPGIREDIERAMEWLATEEGRRSGLSARVVYEEIVEKHKISLCIGAYYAHCRHHLPEGMWDKARTR